MFRHDAIVSESSLIPMVAKAIYPTNRNTNCFALALHTGHPLLPEGQIFLKINRIQGVFQRQKSQLAFGRRVTTGHRRWIVLH